MPVLLAGAYMPALWRGHCCTALYIHTYTTLTLVYFTPFPSKLSLKNGGAVFQGLFQPVHRSDQISSDQIAVSLFGSFRTDGPLLCDMRDLSTVDMICMICNMISIIYSMIRDLHGL